jgi:hypothetical protein
MIGRTLGCHVPPTDPGRVSMRDGSTTKRILTPAIDNWFSRAYLIVCAALLIWTAVDALFVSHDDASFAGVWPIFATLPTSLIVVLLAGGAGFLLPSGATVPLFFLLLVAAALVNATLLGMLVRWQRRPSSRP